MSKTPARIVETYISHAEIEEDFFVITLTYYSTELFKLIVSKNFELQLLELYSDREEALNYYYKYQIDFLGEIKDEIE